MQESQDLVNFSSRYLREESRRLLKGNWNKTALVALIFIVLSGGASGIPKIGSLVNLVLTGPLTLGLSILFLKLTDKQNFEIEDLFKGFDDFVRAFLAHLLIIIFVVLWALLLIVPGIIAGLSYSLTFYILAENPDLAANDARKRSIELMRGHKWQLFTLFLSFIGWAFLCIFTLGIGFFWLMPYINTSVALFYKQAVKANVNNEVNVSL